MFRLLRSPKLRKALLVIAAAFAVCALFAPIASAGPLTVQPQIIGGTIPDPTIAIIVKIIAGAVAVWTLVNGVKDLFPAFAASHPSMLRIFAAVGALLVSLGLCFAVDHAHDYLSVGKCIYEAVGIFVGAVGLHEAKSASDKARAASSIAQFDKAQKQ